jgi:hypothetical protein
LNDCDLWMQTAMVYSDNTPKKQKEKINDAAIYFTGQFLNRFLRNTEGETVSPIDDPDISLFKTLGKMRSDELYA